MVNQDRVQQIYERNPILKMLNHRFPGLFRFVWEAFLVYKKVRHKPNRPYPLHPTTPILQVRNWKHASSQGKHPRLLFFSNTGWSTHMVMDGLLGTALQQRGAQVSYFTCGGVLPVCFIQNASSDVPPMPCGRCRAYADSALRAFGFQAQMLKDLISPRERAQIKAEVEALPDSALLAYEKDGIRIGYYASVSTRWFLLVNVISSDPEMFQRLRGFLFQGVLTHVAIGRLIDQHKPDKIILVNGLHVTEQVVRNVAAQRSVPVVCTERGYLANTFLATHNQPCAFYPLDEMWSAYRDRELHADQQDELSQYLNGRRYGYKQADNIWKEVEENVERLKADLDLKPGRRLIAVFPNVAGDTAIIDRDIGYPNIRAWLDHLVAYASQRPNVDIVIRIHPAETRIARFVPREMMGRYLAEHHPTLPSNLKIIPPESTLSSYTLLEMSDIIAVYSSTTGLEAAVGGKPVVVAGDVHYRGKGFTFDADSREGLTDLLDKLADAPETLNPMLAARYAYLFFFRAMIPLDELLEEGSYGQVRLKITDPNDLRPGRSPVMDTLCDGILNGGMFINPYRKT